MPEYDVKYVISVTATNGEKESIELSFFTDSFCLDERGIQAYASVLAANPEIADASIERVAQIRSAVQVPPKED